MADRMRRLTQNIAGDFFVDDSCIDCDTCRQIAPAHFRDHGDQSSVYRQPETPAEISQALKALVSCPTASIGALTKHDLSQTVASFPSHIAENVYFCLMSGHLYKA
jgi:ferredoxin